MLSSVFNKFFLNIFNFLFDNIKRLLYNWGKEVDCMTIEQQIKMALSYSGISQAELARRLGTTPSNLNQKVKRNTLTKEEMERIAAALGGTWRAEFVFDDGTVIWLLPTLTPGGYNQGAPNCG